MTFEERMEEDRQAVEDWLRHCFDGRASRADLYDAMRYSLVAGGKRLRPILLLESCRMCGGDVLRALPFACGVEMLHTYSLIHDDLPCMDDDDLRRGRPTNHKVFGEATAVLAGDALLTAAFETVLEPVEGVSPAQALSAASCLAKAAGAAGMAGGQALDIAGEGYALSLAEVEELQALKTGALICAAAEMGCILAGGGAEERAAVRQYAQCLGLAFQIRDDMLDVEGEETVLGKPIGSDAENEKTTFVTLKGLDDCRERVAELTRGAKEALSGFEDPGFLCWLADALEARKN
ncbi:polyprenyl synthetase family protein [Pseudoflavonifractor sp. 524-17]|uniref:polyprenyl synthetase family protein n=1 Tax=Pseudoflavonifractor sp. 524-17 TaxID=2304577 RepID=UPI00137AA2F9|nr:farnesyl diphosphate synthase [Pseudoflavonifractor sp. 524-17]NCE64288.1 polyprenyl synthetase family protein [Pseudoflavonifractor sp. 524-17]